MAEFGSHRRTSLKPWRGGRAWESKALRSGMPSPGPYAPDEAYSATATHHRSKMSPVRHGCGAWDRRAANCGTYAAGISQVPEHVLQGTTAPCRDRVTPR